MRRHFNKHIAIIVLAATLGFLSGCVDDMIWKSDPFGGAGIRLGVTVDGSWTNPSSKGTTTRSLGEDGEIIEQEEKPFQDYSISEMKTESGKKVYLHEEVMSWDDANNESPVVTANKKQTRSYIVGSGEGFQPMYDKFGVTAFHYTEDSWPYSNFNVPTLFSNELAQGAAGTYNIPDKYMPPKGGVRMFAYAPANDPYVTYYDNLWGWNIGPALYVRTPKDPRDHKDLLVAYSGDYKIDNTSNNPVNLNFKHALTGVRFSLADDMVNCTIKRIVIKNLQDQGAQYFANLGLWNAIVWTALSKSSDNAMIDMNNLNIKVGPRDDAYDTSIRYLAPMSETLFVIPQTCPADTEINIVIEQDDGKGKTHQELLVGYLGGKELKPGTIVTYRISYDGWWRGLTLTQPDAVDYSGGYLDMNVISFDISNGDIEKRPLPWRLEFCGMTEDEQPDGKWQPTPPTDMLSIQSDNPDDLNYVPKIPDGEEFAGYYGSMIGATERPGHQIQMEIKSKVPDWDYAGFLDDVLYENADKGAVGSEWNLSNPNGYRTGGYNGKGIWTTANCYVVDAPGEYIFPCIYGNGITNGQVNEKSYFPNLLGAGKENVISEGAVLNRFINHLGNGIYNPIINKNAGCNTDENLKVAELEWTDANAMIENIKYDKDAFGGIGGIRFTIKRGSRMAMVNGTNDATESLRTDQLLPNRIGGIRQGNTTISLKDKANGTTMWSWHIWVNPIAYDTRNQYAVTNKTREQNRFMALPLGWVAMQEVLIMRPRGCFVRITNWRDITHMDGTTERVEKSQIVELYQREHFKYYQGFAPSYQWGRKDPFQPGYTKLYSVPWGDKNGWIGWGPALKNSIPPEDWGRELTGLRNRILNPNEWHDLYQKDHPNPEFREQESGDSPVGRDESYYNLWNATRNTCWDHWSSDNTYAPRIEVTKTIYDPCPPGYKVPMLNSFTGFTVNGDNIKLQGGGFGNSKEEMNGPKNWYGNAVEYASYVFLNLWETDPLQWYNEIYPEYKFLKDLADSKKGWQYLTPEQQARAQELSDRIYPTQHYFQLFTDIKVKKHYVNIPMIGHRFLDAGTFTEEGTDGYFWTAESANRNKAYYLCVCNGRGTSVPHINPINDFYHLDGFQILPMADEQAMGMASTVNSAETPVYNLVKTLGPYSRKRPASPAEIEQIRKRREERKKQAKLRMEQSYQQQQQKKNLRLPKITKLRN